MTQSHDCRLTPEDLQRLFPTGEPAAFEECFCALKEYEHRSSDDNFDALLDVLIELGDSLDE